MSNEATLKKQWDAIPQNVRNFMPEIKQNLTDFWTAAGQADIESWSEEQLKESAEKHMEKTQELVERFKAAGGTDKQWNDICYVVNCGYDEKFQP